AQATASSASRWSTPPPGNTVMPPANAMPATLRSRKTSRPASPSRSRATVAASLGVTGGDGGEAGANSSGSVISSGSLTTPCSLGVIGPGAGRSHVVIGTLQNGVVSEASTRDDEHEQGILDDDGSLHDEFAEERDHIEAAPRRRQLPGCLVKMALVLTGVV